MAFGRPRYAGTIVLMEEFSEGHRACLKVRPPPLRAAVPKPHVLFCIIDTRSHMCS